MDGHVSIAREFNSLMLGYNWSIVKLEFVILTYGKGPLHWL